MVSRKLSWKTKSLIDQSIYILTLNCGHEETQKLCRRSGFFFRERVRSSIIWRELVVERFVEVFCACPIGRRPGMPQGPPGGAVSVVETMTRPQ